MQSFIIQALHFKSENKLEIGLIHYSHFYFSSSYTKCLCFHETSNSKRFTVIMSLLVEAVPYWFLPAGLVFSRDLLFCPVEAVRGTRRMERLFANLAHSTAKLACIGNGATK